MAPQLMATVLSGNEGQTTDMLTAWSQAENVTQGLAVKLLQVGPCVPARSGGRPTM